MSILNTSSTSSKLAYTKIWEVEVKNKDLPHTYYVIADTVQDAARAADIQLNGLEVVGIRLFHRTFGLKP